MISGSRFLQAYGTPQTDVGTQLNVTLYRLGSRAVSIPHVALTFGISRGAVQDFTWRRINAIVELAPQFIIWPNAGQKEQICRWFRDKKPFPNAIGAIDGVELVLLRGPSYDTKA
ncbi:hypothetical protein B0O80DRAFT_169098 [Mortierella sp. GBAus27b]|nr:hypothetical protein B0O80DRAFT_169098 [Mortierella sp. GBAus27b]